MATIEHDGYVARIDIDEDNNGFYGRVINITDVVDFRGRTAAELKKEFATSMRIYYEFCKEQGKKPEKPFSGKFVLRVDPTVHAAVTRAAERDGKSINTWIEDELRAAAG